MLFLIIFGRRNSTSVESTGQFNCPRCGPGRVYLHKVVKRWFTLYFIPIIPMGRVGDYVECQSCGGTYGSEILAFALPPPGTPG